MRTARSNGKTQATGLLYLILACRAGFWPAFCLQPDQGLGTVLIVFRMRETIW